MFSCHIHILWYSMTEIKCPTRSKFKVSCWFYCKTLSTTALCNWCWRRGPDGGLTITRRAVVDWLLRICCQSFLSSSCTTKCSTWPPAPLPHPLCRYSWSLLVDPTHVCWEETRATVEWGGDQPSSTAQRYTKCLECCKLRCLPHHSITPAQRVIYICPPQDDGACLCSIVISNICRTLLHAQ